MDDSMDFCATVGSDPAVTECWYIGCPRERFCKFTWCVYPQVGLRYSYYIWVCSACSHGLLDRWKENVNPYQTAFTSWLADKLKFEPVLYDIEQMTDFTG